MAFLTSGADTFSGTTGNDTIEGLGGADLIYGLGGADVLAGFSTVNSSDTEIDRLYGGLGHDSLYGGLNDLLDGGGGRDLAILGLGAVTSGLALTLGADVFVKLGGVNSTRLVGIERINFTGGIGNDTITGGDFDDTLTGGGGFDHLFGGGGNDSFIVSDARFEVRGGAGQDRLTLTSAAVTGDLVLSTSGISIGGLTPLMRGIEAFTVTVANHNATLTGGALDDVVEVTGGTLSAAGGAGNDRLSATGGGTLDGGAGEDSLQLGDAGTAHGGQGNDVLAGYATHGAITLWGDDGDDVITGAKDVTIFGGQGNDRVVSDMGLTGAHVEGGLGQDTMEASLYASTLGVGLRVLGTQIFANDVLINDVTGFEVLRLTGTILGDTITGLATDDLILADGPQDIDLDPSLGGNDLIRTLEGNDTVKAQGGSDTIFGGQGNDLLFGMGGNDRINGDEGNDTLTGGLGSDTLTGGAGADVFVFTRVEDCEMGAADYIFDFVKGTDRIDLSAIDANGVDAGGVNADGAFTFVGGAVFSGQKGELRAFKLDAVTYVRGDINGDKVADFSIQLSGLMVLSAADFVL